jgi:DNA adenine methylase
MDERESSWLSALDRLPAVHERLRGVELRCGPALDVIGEFDREGVAVLLDPPYVSQTRAAPKVYEHEMDDAAHAELLKALVRCRKAKVVLCGYRSTMCEKALAAWNHRAYESPNDGAGGPVKRRMEEMLWWNF